MKSANDFNDGLNNVRELISKSGFSLGEAESIAGFVMMECAIDMANGDRKKAAEHLMKTGNIMAQKILDPDITEVSRELRPVKSRMEFAKSSPKIILVGGVGGTK